MNPVPMKEKHMANFGSQLDFSLCSLVLSFCINYMEVLPRRSHLNNAHLSLIITDFQPCLLSFHCPYKQKFYFHEFLIKNHAWIWPGESLLPSETSKAKIPISTFLPTLLSRLPQNWQTLRTQWFFQPTILNFPIYFSKAISSESWQQQH